MAPTGRPLHHPRPGIYNAVLRSDRFGTGHRLGIQNAPAGGPLQITDHTDTPRAHDAHPDTHTSHRYTIDTHPAAHSWKWCLSCMHMTTCTCHVHVQHAHVHVVVHVHARSHAQDTTVDRPTVNSRAAQRGSRHRTPRLYPSLVLRTPAARVGCRGSALASQAKLGGEAGEG